MPSAGIFAASRRGDSFPLKSSVCHYRVVDVQVLATLVQEYECDLPLKPDGSAEEVSYIFPLPPDAGVCAFKAVIDNGEKVIKGIVKEKDVAKGEYKRAVEKGKTAALLEKHHADIFQVSLGNFKPSQKIAIHISFVSVIQHDGSSPESLRLMIPVTIAPRYGTAPTITASSGAVSSAPNALTLNVSLQMTGTVTSITCPTHPISLTLGSSSAVHASPETHDPKLAHVLLETVTFLDTDVVLVLNVQGLDKPRCTMEVDEKEGTEAYALTFVPRFNLPALPRQEYIFLIDRSGSMEGSRITAVRAALQIMLRSLPSRGTHFNLWSFGSNYSSLWPTSQAYTAKSVEQATTHVDTIHADMGGTELAGALRAVFESLDKREGDAVLPTTLIVLTDGEAWDLERCYAHVREAAGKAAKDNSFTRAFCLGIGDGVSKPMCEGIGKAGNGFAVFVAGNEKPESKLMNLLKAARGAVVRDLHVDWGVPNEQVASEVEAQDEDFEKVMAEPGAEAVVKAIINLFDDSAKAGEADTVALGPTDPVIAFVPPPRLQQAPNVNNLGFPLYPGFRTSLFAIVKKDISFASPSAITLSGNVLGQPVSLSVPVGPTTLPKNEEIGNGLILHTLAARALIEEWENSKTPDNDIHVVRLGTQYSLASTQTSFVAIDDTPAKASDLNDKTDLEREFFFTEDLADVPAGGMVMTSYGAAGADEYDESDDDMGCGLFDGDGGSYDAASDEESDMDMGFGGGGGGGGYKASAAKAAVAEESDDDMGFALMDDDMPAPVSAPIPAAAPAPSVPKPAPPAIPTLESIARASSFDGSFGQDALGNALTVVPPMPKTMATLSGIERAWMTLLVLAYLAKHFAGQPDAWEVLKEKGLDYVRGLLMDVAVGDDVKIEGLIGEWEAEAASAV